nr:hypothetical protein [Tanacetum cinerariifolium]
ADYVIICHSLDYRSNAAASLVSLATDNDRFLALGWLLEDIHMIWAHLEKKRTRLRTYTKSHDDFCKQWLETVSQGLWRRRHDVADLKRI